MRTPVIRLSDSARRLQDAAVGAARSRVSSITAFLTFLPIRTAAIKASMYSTEAVLCRALSPTSDIDRRTSRKFGQGRFMSVLPSPVTHSRLRLVWEVASDLTDRDRVDLDAAAIARRRGGCRQASPGSEVARARREHAASRRRHSMWVALPCARSPMC